MSEILPFKKTVNERLREHLDKSEEALAAALNNEQVTRFRVERVEGLLSRGFVGRMTWLLTGK